MLVAEKQSLWLCCAPAALCALDAALTLHGQPTEYWLGNYAVANELSPTFYTLLQVHPLAFVLGILGWIAVFASLVLLLPATWAMCASVAVMIGHLTGAASWIARHPPNGYALCNGLFLASSVLVVLTLTRGRNAGGGAAIDWKRTGLPGWLRWVVVVLLAMVPVYLFLIPRQP